MAGPEWRLGQGDGCRLREVHVGAVVSTAERLSPLQPRTGVLCREPLALAGLHTQPPEHLPMTPPPVTGRTPPCTSAGSRAGGPRVLAEQPPQPAGPPRSRAGKSPQAQPGACALAPCCAVSATPAASSHLPRTARKGHAEGWWRWARELWAAGLGARTAWEGGRGAAGGGSAPGLC